MDVIKKTRIYDEAIQIDSDKVHEFWKNRVNRDLSYEYNLVNFQDRHPEVAIERDRIEKNKILKLIDIKENDALLDIGCGIGRWYDRLTQIITTGKYIGIDYTNEFISIAQDKYVGDKRCVFLNGDFTRVIDDLNKNGEFRKYDKIFINGVLMYINDKDILNCIDSLNQLINKDGIIYIKESVGIKKRLTLCDFYSDELGDYYNVIYRTIGQYQQLLLDVIDDVDIYACGPTFSDSIDYQKETSNWYWILRKR